MTGDERAELVRLLRGFRDDTSVREMSREVSSAVDCATFLVEFIEGSDAHDA